MPALHPLVSFCVGDEFEIDGRLTDKDGRPLDVTGAQSIEWKLATLDRAVVLDLTLAGGVTVVNAIDGKIKITITPEASAALAPGRYRDQLRVLTASSFMSTQWTGFIDVKAVL